MKNILFVTTSASKLAGSDTGIWFEELSTPYFVLQDAGFNVDIASPKGGRPPADPRAFEPDAITESVKRFQSDKDAMDKFNNTIKLQNTSLQKYDAVFFPGGHGAVVDLPDDEFLKENLGKYFETGKPVVAICHGPGGVVSTKKKNGKSIVDGLKVTCFTNSEETAIGVDKKVPFLLETRLKELGGKFECVEDFKEFAIRDGNLITGQNPASSQKCAELLVIALK